VPGTWSATSEVLARELAPRFAGLTFAELRFRVKSWHELPSCVADTEAALELVSAGRGGSVLLVGFSMGGAVSISAAAHEAVAALLGLAPWIPDELSVEPVRGRRLDVVHGAWDRHLPGIPGVAPAGSRRGFERAVAAGAFGSYALIPRGLHGCAVRRRSGRLLLLPRWRAWVRHTAAVVERHAAP
jgi:pimeloyl-ACP methyl ester carboxylesterase